MVEIVFVHGALVRDGAWWWRPVAELIQTATGVTSRAVLLPSCGEGAAGYDGSGLLEDAAALRGVLDEVDTALIVGHSYGGTVIAQGAEHPAAAHLMYITSYLPDVGQSQAVITGDEPDSVSIALGDDGTLGIAGYDAASFGERFWHDVTAAETKAGAWERVTRQSVEAFGTPTTNAAWQGRQSTYLVCADDRSTSLELQRFHAERATHAVELPTSHHPFLSRPDLVAQQVERILAEL
ncbi:alpha/beta hydrolase [Subtercola lobariae]|uniref:Alpha/beta hydrolase n=1 Tax=Subtercola lobariae TaxID=1588641 RepID=A0A917BDG0_9MICO|nr:alpha/beta hydrolase [Subtercola lobariae]GGF34499.1 alpha/beta hydrolase [Subtercola lobariae]